MPHIALFPVVACTDDAHLGRLEYELLNEQQLMEFLIAKVNNKDIFRDEHGNFLDACEWDDVECSRNDVETIAWNHDWGVVDLMKGTIELDWLPPKLKKVNMSDQSMEGTLSIKLLPQSIKQVYLGCNRLSGTLDMVYLPESILVLHLDCNRFEGELVLTSLPSNLQEIELDENLFRAKVLVVDFPETVTSYAFDGNEIEKIVDINGKELPESLI